MERVRGGLDVGGSVGGGESAGVVEAPVIGDVGDAVVGGVGVGEVVVGVFEADLAQVLHWGEADVAAEPFLQRTETAAGDLCEAGGGE